MRRLEHPAARAVIAIAFGLPITALLGAPALFLVGVSAFGIPFTAFQAIEGHHRADFLFEQFGRTLLWLGWGAFGVAGICGLWAWVLTPRPINHKGRVIVSALLAAGVIAAVPVMITWYDGLFHWLAVAGVAVAALMIVQLCFLTTRSSGP